MNKYRLNQVLETLLFSLTDPKQCKEDNLFACYREYYKNKGDRSKYKVTYQLEDSRFYKERNALIGYLVDKNHWRVKSEDDVEKICDFFHSMDIIDKYMMSMEEGILVNGVLARESISGYYILKVLPLISNSLLTYRDGVAAIRPWKEKEERDNRQDIFSNIPVFNKIEVWNLLCRMCSPDIFVAIEAVECNLGLEALFGQRTSIVLADKLLVKSLQNGMAENHIHFNVGYDYDVLWLYNMRLEQQLPINDESLHRGIEQDILLKCAVYRCITAVYLEEGSRNENFEEWIQSKFGKDSAIVYILDRLRVGDYEFTIDSKMKQEIHILYNKVTVHSPNGKYDYLFDKVYSKYIKYETTSEYIFLFKCYKYIKKENRDILFSHLFLQYIRLKNFFYGQFHERNLLVGYKYFQKKYRVAAGNLREIFPEEERLLELFRAQSKIRYLRKFEIRITPDVGIIDISPFVYQDSKNYILRSLYKQLLIIFTSYRRFIKENVYESRMQEKTNEMPNMGIVFHLLKREYVEDISGVFCWKNTMIGNRRRTEHIFERRYFIRNIAKAIEEIRQSIPKMDEYIVGLDAASDEVIEEPWVYSMAYQTVRSRKSTKPVVQNTKYSSEYNRVQNIGFTYHVGEEFSHIISGLRHIDEVIEEFGYKPGDRIGHAMAIGIDVKQWIEDNKVIMMPQLEYMENLLWIWGVGIYENGDLGIELEKLESRILDIASKFYVPSEGLTVRLLYQAYKEKFRGDHKKAAEKHLKDRKERAKEDDFCANKGCKCCVGEKWTKEGLLLTNYCPRFIKQYRTIMALNVTREDVELFEALQNHVVKKIEKKGIYIETNPTSNLVIGEFMQMDMHPIFSMNGRKTESHVMVTINSDDPAVFGTNIENEFAYIYYAAEAQGYSKEEILEWIDKIRVHGMNASFIQVEKSVDVILREVEDIINQIKYKLRGGKR